MAIDIGRIAYQAYVDELEAQECDCDLPKWEEIGQYEQNAWRHSAIAVSQYLDKCRRELDEEVAE